MAVVESIPEKNQTPSAQKGVMDYCMQPSKTFDEDEQLAYISGYNCVPELANESHLILVQTVAIRGLTYQILTLWKSLWCPIALG